MSLSTLDEYFYIVSWVGDADGTPLLVVGGINGIICVIDAGNEKIHKSFMGHGDFVNEIRKQALRPSLLLSTSKDEYVRLWNVQTGICILIFVGTGGHHNEVLSVGTSFAGPRIKDGKNCSWWMIDLGLDPSGLLP